MLVSSDVSLHIFSQDEPPSQSNRCQVSGHHGRPAHVEQQSDVRKTFVFFSWKGNRLRILTKRNAFGLQDVDVSALLVT